MFDIINKKGFILIVAYLALSVLLIISAALLSRAFIDKRLFDINLERSEAFYIAEAGADAAIVNLQGNYGYTGTPSPVTLGRGEYESIVTAVGSTKRKIITTGYIPTKNNVRISRGIEAVTKRQTPANFFSNALYSAGDVDFKGNSYTVNGPVVYSTTANNTGRVNGSVTQDSTISPLAQFDFSTLRNIAIAQGNYYSAARLQQGDPFPAGFWYQAPTDSEDPTTGIPNVVYVEGALTLSGNTTAGGLYFVVGNILSDPTVTIDTTINGNVTLNGCIYTTGDFTINGGGNGLNVNGGVWAGTGMTIKGNATVNYNSNYMTSVSYLIDVNNLGGVVQLYSWRQLNQ